MWLITSWGKSQPLVRPCLPFTADFCLMFLRCFTPSHCIYNWGHGLFLTRSSCFTDPPWSKGRHDSDVCSVGVSKADFSGVTVNLFVYILTAGNHSVTLRFVVRVIFFSFFKKTCLIFRFLVQSASILLLIPTFLYDLSLFYYFCVSEAFWKNPCLKCNDSHKPALLHKSPIFLFPSVCQKKKKKKKKALSISVFFPPRCSLKWKMHLIMLTLKVSVIFTLGELGDERTQAAR